MLSNTNMVFKESETSTLDHGPTENLTVMKKMHKALMLSSCVNPEKKKIHSCSFAPILEEDNYDHVVVNKTKEERKEIIGPSYLDAIRFASVYNDEAE
jgi:hypothetical protein